MMMKRDEQPANSLLSVRCAKVNCEVAQLIEKLKDRQMGAKFGWDHIVDGMVTLDEMTDGRVPTMTNVITMKQLNG